MMVLGLTGGMGSGKTTVAAIFKKLGIPVFIADEAGQHLLNTSDNVKKAVVKLFGPEVYQHGTLNRKAVAARVFANKKLLEELNRIVHPAVASSFENWKKQQRSHYVVYEAAFHFEKGAYRNCDLNLLIRAPLDKKIQRLQKRDQSTLEEIQARMNHQWTDQEKVKLADFVIENDDLEHTQKAVERLHQILLKSA